MKIKEALDIINGTTTVKAKYNNHSIFVCFKFLPFDGHCFLALRADVKTWDSVTLVSGAIDDVIPEDLARVMDVVQRLLDTPLDKRKPEKKYRLRWMDNEDDGAHNYLDNRYGIWSCETDTRLYTESDIKQLKELNPHLAPAIEAMKEEVKDDAC